MSLALVLSLLGQLTSYVDDQGTTHYVQSPAEVPAKYRKRQKPLEADISEVAGTPMPERKEPRPTRAAPTPTPEAKRAPSNDADERRAREAANARDAKLRSTPSDVRTTCVGKHCYSRFTVKGEGAKPGSSCASGGASCTVGAECCSGRCGSALTCE
jgi:hypothetical protein